MDEKSFFEMYLPALEKALDNDETNYGFLVKTPDWYIEDEFLCKQMDLFEEENIDKYRIFDMVGIYFDAKSHNFDEIRGADINKYREKILNEIKWLKYTYLQ